jgi:lambda family phage portal protein
MTFRPNIFDRALLAISPERALARMQARMAAEILVDMSRAYDGAKSDRRLGGWVATGSSANAELYGANERLRARARDLDRNHQAVAAARAQFAGKVVGTGITPRAVDSRKTLRQIANDAWSRFVESCDVEGESDYYTLQAQAAGAMFRDGEALRVWLPDESGLPDGKIRILEADFLDSTRDTVYSSAKDGSVIVQGVEFNRSGARAGYWLYPTHPGDMGGVAPGGLMRGMSRLTAAADVDHIFQALRPGQTRGVSWLAPSIVTLRGGDDVREALIWRKRLEACMGLVIRTPDAQGPLPAMGAQSKDEKGRRLETLSPGFMARLGPGEDVTAFQPSSSGDTMEFLRAQLFAFAATTPIAAHAITGDASQANYSSMRAAELAGNVILDAVQWLVFAPRERRAWRRVMRREAKLRNDPRLVEVRCEFSMPVRPWVDPVKEITAKIMEIRAGLMSQPDALAERGLNWEQWLEETQSFLAAIDEAKVILDTDPRKVNDSGALQAAKAAQTVSN